MGSASGRESGGLVGTARRVQQRQQLYSGTSVVFLDFVVEEAGGGQGHPVAMSGVFLQGTLADGDLVEIPRDRAADGVLTPERFRNATTGTSVVMTTGRRERWELSKATQGARSSRIAWGLQLLFLAIFVAIALWIVIGVGGSLLGDPDIGQLIEPNTSA